VLGPAVEVLVHGFGVVELGLCHGDLVVADAVDVLTHAHGDGLATGDHVQLGEEEVGDAVDTCRVTGDGCVEPTAAAVTAGGDPVLATVTAQPLAFLVEQFGRERPGTHTGGVGLEDSDDLRDACGAQPGARGGSA